MSITDAWRETLREICESLDDAEHQLEVSEVALDRAVKPVDVANSPRREALLIAEMGITKRQ